MNQTTSVFPVISGAVVVAIGCAAAKQFTTPSEYIRRSLLQALRADGIDPDKFMSEQATAK